MNITLTDLQRRALLNLLRKSSAGGTKLPPISRELDFVLKGLETPLKTEQQTYTFPILEDTAREINNRLYTQLGFLMEEETETPEHPQVEAQRLAYKAIESKFPTYKIMGMVPRKIKKAAPTATTPQTNEATLHIVSEVDGDITGYFVLRDNILAALNASTEDVFGYLTNANNTPPIMHTTLLEALADIMTQGPELVGDFGCCAY